MLFSGYHQNMIPCKSAAMCARVEIVLWIVKKKKKKKKVIFIELKKKKSQLSLFSIFVHKLFYFVSVIFGS